jgi:hypothetical protein
MPNPVDLDHQLGTREAESQRDGNMLVQEVSPHSREAWMASL